MPHKDSLTLQVETSYTFEKEKKKKKVSSCLLPPTTKVSSLSFWKTSTIIFLQSLPLSTFQTEDKFHTGSIFPHETSLKKLKTNFLNLKP